MLIFFIFLKITLLYSAFTVKIWLLSGIYSRRYGHPKLYALTAPELHIRPYSTGIAHTPLQHRNKSQCCKGVCATMTFRCCKGVCASRTSRCCKGVCANRTFQCCKGVCANRTRRFTPNPVPVPVSHTHFGDRPGVKRGRF